MQLLYAFPVYVEVQIACSTFLVSLHIGGCRGGGGGGGWLAAPISVDYLKIGIM